ncbi:MAG: UDP-N-acetylmuramoyl-L-alanine--D-glutamate ligase [Bacteroidales bacterium]|nr:UDP-N-acetylmuramoyl-L-alanine--D-glutamate ligase [Bacteroidales bacterium]
MVELFRRRLEGKTILLLGFGREGESSYQLIRELFPDQMLWIADRNPGIAGNILLTDDSNVTFQCGEDYLQGLNRFDLILKSPGISLKDLKHPAEASKITSQTDIFLEIFWRQTIGITGTKGKSTTSSLIAHILNTGGRDSVLLGNIGTPAWHFFDRITPETVVVDELSSHQLEYIRRGPHIALLLNIYEEHLDAYISYQHYQAAKMNIATTQTSGDYLLYNADDPIIRSHISSSPVLSSLIPMSLHLQYDVGAFRRNSELVFRVPGREELVVRDLHNRYLKGEHNLRNIMAAVAASWLQGVSEEAILDGLASFKGLAHRMEYVGYYHNIHWVNDSIATIPEASVAAVQSLPEVDTLILGGFDRGISYEAFARFLIDSQVRTLILVGDAGRRLGREIEKIDETIKERKNLFYINRFDHLLPLAVENTLHGTTCLLSPAASSYDEFRSFEERGFRFCELIKEK